MNNAAMPDLSKIKLLILDVDGVLTDGSIIISADGSESKRFSVLDGHGIKLWHRAGFRTAIISGRTAHAVTHRARELGITYVFQDCVDKLPVFEKLVKEAGCNPDEVAYIGDDVVDIPIMRRVGFAAAVADAVDEVKEHAAYVTGRQGGKGAVREVIDHLLRQTPKWDELMKRYLV